MSVDRPGEKLGAREALDGKHLCVRYKDNRVVFIRRAFHINAMVVHRLQWCSDKIYQCLFSNCACCILQWLVNMVE